MICVLLRHKKVTGQVGPLGRWGKGGSSEAPGDGEGGGEG